MTTPDKLDSFDSLKGGSGGGSAPASTGGAKPAAGGQNAAVVGEFEAAISGLVDPLKAAAEKVGNDSVKQGTQFFVDALNLNTALLKTMTSFRKPSNVAFCT